MLKPLDKIKIEKPLVVAENLSDYKIPRPIRQKIGNILSGLGYSFDDFTSYTVTEK